jgi:hypothetical protein
MSASGIAWYRPVSNCMARSGVGSSGIPLITQSSFELLNELPQSGTKFFANQPHLDVVNSPFASFHLADAGLFKREFIAKLLLLSDPRLCARLDQKLEEDCISGGMNALLQSIRMYSKME